MAAPRAWALFPSIESTFLRSAGDYHIDNLVNNIEDSDIIQVFLGNDAPESETAVAAVAEDMASNILKGSPDTMAIINPRGEAADIKSLEHPDIEMPDATEPADPTNPNNHCAKLYHDAEENISPRRQQAEALLQNPNLNSSLSSSSAMRIC
ncbi:hypothetical protein FQN51_004579 [Onygenales sp. PD_10]|nr:hypothetical protein FQN51_004579 [Onygenales sp. PD_10]